MKKFLFFIIVALLFCGCDKNEGGDPECPITDVSLPVSSAENPVRPGTEVTISGKGFTQSCEIWLHSVTEVKAAGAEVKAAVTSVTALAITFTAPEVYGAQTVVLKQNGDAWELGKIYFPAILPKKITKIVSAFDSETQTTEYTYDEAGRVKQIDKTEEYDGYNSTSTTSIEYAQNRVTVRYGKHDDPDFAQDIFHQENGHATNSRYSESDYECKTKYFYGDNGYLTTAEITEIQTDREDTHTIALTIKNDCLEKYSDEEGYSIGYTPNTAVPNNLNLDLLGFDEFMDDIDEGVAETYWLGIGGTRTKYLPEQLTVTDWEGDQFTIKYEYIFDGEYISEIRMMSDDMIHTLKLYYEE